MSPWSPVALSLQKKEAPSVLDNPVWSGRAAVQRDRCDRALALTAPPRVPCQAALRRLLRRR
jgi:hypothetical protein